MQILLMLTFALFYVICIALSHCKANRVCSNKHYDVGNNFGFYLDFYFDLYCYYHNECVGNPSSYSSAHKCPDTSTDTILSKLPISTFPIEFILLRADRCSIWNWSGRRV